MVGAARVSASRELILARVRDAIAGSAAGPPVPREYRRAGGRDQAATIELLCERIGAYQAEVRRVDPAGLRAAVGAAFAQRGAARICIPSAIPAHWRPDGCELVEDDELANVSLDRLDGVLTGCTLAIAETGTIVLTAAAREGRRALSLVPDLHVCVIEEEQVVELVPQGIAILAEIVRGERRPITLISGPSATSDIELNRVEGVHGPRTLVVLVLAKELA
jgi:L-lactate dehydrogenase complex protein LldG